MHHKATNPPPKKKVEERKFTKMQLLPVLLMMRQLHQSTTQWMPKRHGQPRAEPHNTAMRQRWQPWLRNACMKAKAKVWPSPNPEQQPFAVHICLEAMQSGLPTVEAHGQPTPWQKPQLAHHYHPSPRHNKTKAMWRPSVRNAAVHWHVRDIQALESIIRHKHDPKQPSMPITPQCSPVRSSSLVRHRHD